MGKSSVTTSCTPPNQKSKPQKGYRVHVNNIQTLSPWSSPDNKEFRWTTTTKASSPERKTSQYSKKRDNNGNQNSYGYGYGKYKPGNLVQQSGISLFSTSAGSKTHASLHKKLILCKRNSKFAVSRKVKNLYRKLENSDLLNILKKGDNMCKLDLKEAYFSVPLNPASRKFARFLWSRKLHEFLCLCFGLGPVPRIFTKLLKIQVSVLRCLNILIIVYMDDMSLIGHTIGETLMARDTVIFLLQQLGFVMNLKKSVLTPTERVEFLGVPVDSLIMILSREESLKSSEAVSGTSSENISA